jgi:hypothetical protein
LIDWATVTACATVLTSFASAPGARSFFDPPLTFEADASSTHTSTKNKEMPSPALQAAWLLLPMLSSFVPPGVQQAVLQYYRVLMSGSGSLSATSRLGGPLSRAAAQTRLLLSAVSDVSHVMHTCVTETTTTTATLAAQRSRCKAAASAAAHVALGHLEGCGGATSRSTSLAPTETLAGLFRGADVLMCLANDEALLSHARSVLE